MIIESNYSAVSFSFIMKNVHIIITYPFRCVPMQTLDRIIGQSYKKVRRVAILKFRPTNINDAICAAKMHLGLPKLPNSKKKIKNQNYDETIQTTLIRRYSNKMVDLQSLCTRQLCLVPGIFADKSDVLAPMLFSPMKILRLMYQPISPFQSKL